MNREEIGTEIVQALAEMISHRANNRVRLVYRYTHNDPRFADAKDEMVMLEVSNLRDMLDRMMEDESNCT